MTQFILEPTTITLSDGRVFDIDSLPKSHNFMNINLLKKTIRTERNVVSKITEEDQKRYLLALAISNMSIDEVCALHPHKTRTQCYQIKVSASRKRQTSKKYAHWLYLRTVNTKKE